VCVCVCASFCLRPFLLVGEESGLEISNWRKEFRAGPTYSLENLYLRAKYSQSTRYVLIDRVSNHSADFQSVFY
jgi:hypothetical protein